MSTPPDWHPGTLLELSGSYWKTCALHAAVKLDLFTIIGEKELSGAQIAEQSGSDEDAVSRLLDALTALGLLKKEAGRYRNTEASIQFLSAASPGYIGHMIMHHHHLVPSWQRLHESVRTGRANRESASFGDATVRTAFLKGMFNNASLMAPQLVEAITKQVDLTSCRTMLDMGGGPGTYAIHFCKTLPDLTATVMDLPTTRVIAEEIIADAGLSDRVTFMDGNYVEEDVSGNYDFVWMSHILHGEGHNTCREMITKAYKSLTSGGRIIIHEFILNNDRSGPLFPALFSLNMLVGTDDGRAYTEEELFDMLQAAGFGNISRLDFRGPTESGLIVGEKQS